jgi:hypothetical protein
MRDAEGVSGLGERRGELADLRLVVERRRRDPQALGAARHRRVVDRLDVDGVVLQQAVGRHLAQLGVADHHRHDVGLGLQDRQARRAQGQLGGRRLALVRLALGARARGALRRAPPPPTRAAAPW